MTITAVRGTQDLLPGRSGLWQEVEHKCRRLAYHCGFQEIRTPMFEKADLFVRGLGVMAGLVERDLWTFHDKHGQKLALRADLTACVVRAYSEHGLSSPSRLYYVAPVFLLGKESGEPSRQAHQFGVEVIGCESPAVDAELMAMAVDLANSLGLPEVTIELNTLGCDRCRPAYHDCLRDFYNGHATEMCGNCKRKYKSHPLWTLSCPESACMALAQVSPTIFGLLCQDCKSHFHMVKQLVRDMGLPVNLNPRVVKDVEYYNRTTFQILSRGQVIGNGGRYDDLVKQLGGSDTPGLGFAFNLEPIVDILAEQLEEYPDELEVLLIPEGEEATKVMMPVLHRLRQAGVRAEVAYTSAQPASRYIGRLVEANALRGHAQIEDLDANDIEKVSPDRLVARLLSRLGLDENSTPESRSANNRRKLTRSRSGARRNGAPDHSEAREQEGGDEAGRRRRRRRRRSGGGDEEVSESAAPRPREDRGEARGGGRGERSRGLRGGRDRGRDSERDSSRARPERESGRDRNEAGRDRSEAGRDRSDAGRDRSDAGRDRSERDSGRERSERDSGRERSERDSGRDRSERDAGRDRSERDAGRDRSERDAPRDRAERDAPRDRGERDAPRDRGEREAGRDRGGRDAPRDRAEREAPRDRGEREAPRDRGEREAPRDRGEREAPRDRGEREAPRDRGEREAPRDRGEREGGRDRGERDSGRDRAPRGDRDRAPREAAREREAAPEREAPPARERGGRDAGRGRGTPREEDSGKAFIPALILGAGATRPMAAASQAVVAPKPQREPAPMESAKALNWSVAPKAKKTRASSRADGQPDAPHEAEETRSEEEAPAAAAPRRRTTRRPAEPAAKAAPASESSEEKAPARRSRARRTEEK